MLFHAMWNVGQVDAIIGAVALLVDAKDEEAKRFYIKYGFIELPDRHPRAGHHVRRCVALATVRKSLAPPLFVVRCASAI